MCRTKLRVRDWAVLIHSTNQKVDCQNYQRPKGGFITFNETFHMNLFTKLKMFRTFCRSDHCKAIRTDICRYNYNTYNFGMYLFKGLDSNKEESSNSNEFSGFILKRSGNFGFSGFANIRQPMHHSFMRHEFVVLIATSTFFRIHSEWSNW